jgi:ribosomal protein S18 acetylase RimI-like enzyme
MMRIEEVSLEDLNHIHNLEKKVFENDAFSKALMKKLIRRSTFFIKLERKGIRIKLIGFAIVVKDRRDRVNIINFVINPKFQNKGYGTYLLTDTMNRIKEMGGIRQIVLNVKVDNSIAVYLYEKFKFKIVKRIDNYYQSGDAGFLMELNL